MKNLIYTLILIPFISLAQVGINTVNPNSSLDIVASSQATPDNNDGILIPRIDAFPATNPGAAQDSMIVYLTSVVGLNNPGFYYWNNATTTWIPFGSSSSDQDWFEEGTTSAPNDITDNMFTQGNVAIGTNVPTAVLHAAGVTVPGTSGGVATLLDEDFESVSGNIPDAAGSFPYEDNANAGACIAADGWRIDTADSASDAPSVCSGCLNNRAVIDFGAAACDPQDATLILSSFTPTQSAINISFDYGFTNFEGNGPGDVFTGILFNVTTNTPTNILGTLTADAFDQTLLVLGQTVVPGNEYQIRFRYQAEYDYGATVDNVTVIESVPASTGSYVFRLEDGQQQNGYVLTSDANGYATWEPATSGTDSQLLSLVGNDLTISNGNTVTLTEDWTTTGNIGTDDTVNFIGTTDNQEFVFKTNNIEYSRLTTKGQFELSSVRNNMFIGRQAGESFDPTFGFARRNIYIGEQAGFSNVVRSDNIGIGFNAMRLDVLGSNSIAIGSYALERSDESDESIAIGRGALAQRTKSFGNIGVGHRTLSLASRGDRNTALGVDAGRTTEGDDSVYIGYEADEESSGERNVVIGSDSGVQNLAAGDPSGRVLIGYNVWNNQPGDNILAIENSNSVTPLIYGEFDSDIVRIGGQLQVGSSDDTTAGSIYRFPTTDGTTGQVLVTDGSGNITWTTSAAASNDWTTSGNAGTNEATNFIGTTDLQDLRFRTNNTVRMRVADNGRIGINFPEQTFAQTFSYSADSAVDALYGFSAADGGTGVRGRGQGANGVGVFGFINNTTGVGVVGSNAANGVGVLGIAQNAEGTGLVGIGEGFTYATPVGYSTGLAATSQVGVYGISLGAVDANRYGGYFVYDTDNDLTTSDGDSPTAFLAGRDSNYLGVDINFGGYFSGGQDTTASTPNTSPDDNGTGNTADFAYVGARWGNTNYKILGNGVVSTIIEGEGDNDHIMFAPEAPEVLFQDYGIGKLENGKAEISIDPILRKNIVVDEKHPLKVFIQLEGDCNGVYVTNKSENGFTVKELQNGNSNVSFSYQIIASRADRKDANGKILSKNQDVRLPIAPKAIKNKERKVQKLQMPTESELNK